MADKTVLDTQNSISVKTVIEQDVSGIALGALQTFRGGKVIKEFEALGAEADVFVLEREDKKFFLKLYRKGIKIEEEVFSTIQKLSREHPVKEVDYQFLGMLILYLLDKNLFENLDGVVILNELATKNPTAS
jgi:hypothetical protein